MEMAVYLQETGTLFGAVGSGHTETMCVDVFVHAARAYIKYKLYVYRQIRTHLRNKHMVRQTTRWIKLAIHV